MKNLLTHWKTTSAGVLSIVGGIVVILNDKTKIMEAATAIMLGIGLILGADASNVESK